MVAPCRPQPTPPNHATGVVDIHQAFRGRGLRCSRFWEPRCRSEDPTCWYDTNIEDPNERGYDTIRRCFLLKMVEVFCKPSS